MFEFMVKFYSTYVDSLFLLEVQCSSEDDSALSAGKISKEILIISEIKLSNFKFDLVFGMAGNLASL